MTDETLPLDACCGNCGYYITSAILSGCVLPMIIGNGFMVHVDDNHVCRDWEPRCESE